MNVNTVEYDVDDFLRLLNTQLNESGVNHQVKQAHSPVFVADDKTKECHSVRFEVPHAPFEEVLKFHNVDVENDMLRSIIINNIITECGNTIEYIWQVVADKVMKDGAFIWLCVVRGVITVEVTA